jgi:hypothetical protein
VKGIAAHLAIGTRTTGGVLELRHHDTSMVEITTIPELDEVERIIFPPVSKLRRIGRARTGVDKIAA